MNKILVIFGSLLFSACGSTGIPDNVKPVTNFELTRYLGTWYEVARLDHSFERGLDNVTAQYSQRADGSVRVLNMGYNKNKNAWKDAEGKAYFVSDNQTAHLKVSFFGPFYGSYVVFDLDDNYQYSLVSGPNYKYLWILSRKPELDNETMQRLIEKARKSGFDISKLIYVDHST